MGILFFKCFFISILVFLAGKQLSAQEPFYYSFPYNHELNSQRVYQLMEDETGNIWMATNNGLYKWNGREIQTYINKDYSTAYTGIKQSADKEIYCQNFYGQLFKVEGDSLVLKINLIELVQSTWDYYLADNNRFFYVGEYGVIEFDLLSGELLQVYPTFGVNFYSKQITFRGMDIFKDVSYSPIQYKEGFIYQSRSRLFYFNLNTNESHLVMYGDNLLNNYQRIIYYCNNNELYCTIQGEETILIHRKEDIDKPSEKVIEIEKKNEEMLFSKCIDSSIFIGTTKRLIIVRKGKMIVQENYLQNNMLSDALVDFGGNYWLSTLNSGVILLPNLKVFTSDNSLQNSVINQLYSYNQSIYAISFDQKVWQYRNFRFNVINAMEGRSERPSLIEEDGDIINDFGGDILNLNTQEKRNLQLLHGTKSVSKLSDQVYISSNSGSCVITSIDSMLIKQNEFYKGQKIYYAPKKNGSYIILDEKRSLDNIYDKEHNCIYVSYFDRLMFYTPQLKSEVLINGISIANSILDIDQNERIWCSTRKGSIYQLDNGTAVKEINTGYSVTAIKGWRNYLFLNTPQGIVKLNKENEEMILINELDGLPSNTVYDIEVLNDTLYAATKKGLAFFACNESFINTTPPRIFYDYLTADNEIIKTNEAYNLPFEKNNLTFWFHGISTRSMGEFYFKYRLIGIDDVWQSQSSTVNFARYPSLLEGEYEFQLKAVNEDDFESNIISIPIRIAPPFYRTWWFFALLAFLIVVLSFFVFLIRLNVLKKQNQIMSDKKELEKKLSISQLTALKSQMNPHFVFNALNSIQDYIIKNQKELASDYLGLFADLMRTYLNYSQEDEISIENELEALEMYLKLEKVRFEESLNYSIEVDDALDVYETKIPVMLIQPFVENAIKHGLLHKKGIRKLLVKFTQENNRLLVEVRDNGIGRKASGKLKSNQNKKHQSFSTSSIQNRIKLLNATRSRPIEIVYDDLADQKGTSVKIYL